MYSPNSLREHCSRNSMGRVCLTLATERALATRPSSFHRRVIWWQTGGSFRVLSFRHRPRTQSRSLPTQRRGPRWICAQQHPFLFWSAFIKPRRTEGVTEGVGAARRPRRRCPRDGQAGQAEPRAPAARQLGPGPNFPSEVCVHLRRPTRLQTLASSHRAGPWECRVNCV